MHLRIAPMLESTEGAVRTTFALLRQFECLALRSAANVYHPRDMANRPGDERRPAERPTVLQPRPVRWPAGPSP